MTDNDRPSIETVVAQQAERGITGHLVWMGRGAFVLAHTDEERASGRPLHECRVHRALAALDGYGGDVGYFRADVAGGRLELTVVAP